MLKPEQVECISNISKSKDVFLWLPTGFGKYLCCVEKIRNPFRQVDHKHASSIIASACVVLDWRRHKQQITLTPRIVQVAMIDMCGTLQCLNCHALGNNYVT